MISTEHRVAVVTGSAGVVARLGADVVVIGGRGSAVTNAMAQLSSADEHVTGPELIRRLQLCRDVDVAAIVHVPGGFETVAIGNGLVATPDASPVGADSVAVWVGIGPVPSDAVGRLGKAPHLDLQRGSAPGQGALVASPVLVDEVTPSVEIVGPEAVTASRAPLPILEPPASPPEHRSLLANGTEVLGIRCSREHFNNPRAAYCQVCGISMVHITHYLVPGTRPTLGFLVFDDGTSFALDRSYCIGREPRPDASRELAALVLDDASHSVSRSHAELVLDGWDLVVHDLGSTNGTFVWNPERASWIQVTPGQPFIIQPGMSVAVGRKTFVYESVARPV